MTDAPQPDQRTDEQLVCASNAGDTAAFEALYRRHRDWVVRVATRFSHSREDAWDAMQETFVYLLRKLPQLRLTSRMTTFLYPVVKHAALNIRRKRDRESRMEELPEIPTTTDDADPESKRNDLATVLARLDPAQREVVLMRFVDDMSLREIGDVLGIPVGTVKSRLHLAIRALRQDPHTRAYFEN